MNEIEKHIIRDTASVREALIKLNNIPGSLTLFIVNSKEQIVGTITDGDIRRGFINGFDINSPLEKFYFKSFHYLKKGEYDQKEINKIKEKNIEIVPLIDDDHKIIGLYNFRKLKTILPVDAVIMAGGEGKRLRPLTEKMPKPLIRVGGKPILQYTIDRLEKFGIQDQYLTLNYLADQIIDYCSSLDTDIKFHFIREEIPLGTIGALKLIDNFSHDDILILNSDLLTNINYESFYNEFINENADMMVASIPYNITLPYAIFETKSNEVLSFKEKPGYTYFANAGIYIIKRELLGLIESGIDFNATDLMEKVIENKLKLVHYPVRTYWLDIGRMEDLTKAQTDIAHINWD